MLLAEFCPLPLSALGCKPSRQAGYRVLHTIAETAGMTKTSTLDSQLTAVVIARVGSHVTTNDLPIQP